MCDPRALAFRVLQQRVTNTISSITARLCLRSGERVIRIFDSAADLLVESPLSACNWHRRLHYRLERVFLSVWN